MCGQLLHLSRKFLFAATVFSLSTISPILSLSLSLNSRTLEMHRRARWFLRLVNEIVSSQDFYSPLDFLSN